MESEEDKKPVRLPVQQNSWSALPEVHYHPDSSHLPEPVVETNFPEVVPDDRDKQTAATYYNYHSSPSNHAELAATTSRDDIDGKSPGVRKRGRKKKVVLGVSITVVVLAIVAIAVGIVVSQRNGNSANHETKTDNSTSTSTTTAAALFGTPTSFPSQLPASTCSGTNICPALLASANLPSSNTTLLFTRSSSSEIQYREIITINNNNNKNNNTNSGNNEMSKWKSPNWTRLGTTKKFTSQPSTISSNNRIDVFAVSAEGDESPNYIAYTNGIWESEWISLGGVAKSPAVVCSTSPGSNMIVSVIGGNAGIWRKSTEDGGNFWGPSGARGGLWGDDGGAVDASLGSVCVGSEEGGGNRYFVEAGCGTEMDGRFPRWKMWNDSSSGVGNGWYVNSTGGDWFEGEGVACRGNPTLVWLPGRTKEITCFVVGAEDQAIWFFNISAESGSQMGEPVSLGGRFQSVVEHFLTGTRLDLLVVGENARLKHKVYIDGRWDDAWEDLGGYFNSAPKMVRLNDSAVAVYGIGPNGVVIHSIFPVGTEATNTWGLQHWYEDGGEMSSLSY
ncbi:hypothetical protein V8F33_013994 [Rhypophila sp. PSN 637]